MRRHASSRAIVLTLRTLLLDGDYGAISDALLVCWRERRAAPAPQVSPDGKFYWDGQRWQPASSPESPVAQKPPAPLSPDGTWWWDGQHWQPTELQLSRLRAQAAVHTPIKHSPGSAIPVVAGLFGCLSIGMILLGAAAAVVESNNHSVCESGTGQLAQVLVQALQLAFGDSNKPARLSVNQSSRLQVVEDDDSALLSSVQNDPAIHAVTDSVFASGVTDSLYFHWV